MNEFTGQLSGHNKGFICALYPTCWLIRSLTRASFLGWFQFRTPPRQQSAAMGWWDPPPNDSVIFLDELMALPLLFTINVNFICQGVYFPGNGLLLQAPPLHSPKLKPHWSPVASWILSVADLRTCSLFNSGSKTIVVFNILSEQDISLLLLRLSIHCSTKLRLQPEALWMEGWRCPCSSGHQWSLSFTWTERVSRILIHVTCLPGCHSSDSWFSKQRVVSLSAFHWCKLSFNSPVPQLGERVLQLSRVVRSQR